jgi:hypothetical protein
MVEFLEKLLHDGLWKWLEEQDEYSQIGSEITLGNSGRIDLVARTVDGEQVGFEVKADVAYKEGPAFSEGDMVNYGLCKQLSKYASSGYLDKLYYVSPDVSSFLSLGEVTTYSAGRELYMGYGWSLYKPQFEGMPPYNTTLSSAEEIYEIDPKDFESWRETIDTARENLENKLPDSFLRAFDMDEFMSKVAKSSKAAPETQDAFGYDVLSLSQTVDRLLEMQIEIPPEIGAIRVPLEIGKKEGSNYRQELLHDPDSLFSGSPELSFEIVRNAEPLERTHKIKKLTNNEAWVQHYVWREMGDLREGYVPVGNGDARLIDVIGFRGGIHPTDILEGQGDIIGIEAKDGNIPESRFEQIVEQLISYHRSGALSQVYLAVPHSAVDIAKSLLQTGISELDDIGLLTVDKDGMTKIHRSAARLELRYDSYQTDNGYLRAVVYGRLKLRDSSEFLSTRRTE